MTPQLPWVFEPCENEGPVNDPAGQPWQHAVRGRRPLRPVVTGYGHSEGAADADARTKASQADAREVLDERGELVPVKLGVESVYGTPVPARFDDTRFCGTIAVMPWSEAE